MEIYFLRHGESKSGVADYRRSLTDIGRAQTKALATEWRDKGIRFKKIIASPFIRTQQTAEIVGDIFNCHIEIDDEWSEVDNKHVKKQNYYETSEGIQIPKFDNLFESIGNEKGESYWKSHIRAMLAIENVIKNASGNYLIVSHLGIINAVMRMIIGARPPIKGNGLYFQLGHAGYLRTEYNLEDNMWIIKELNGGHI